MPWPSSSAVYGEETWFRLGDRDLATHIVRTARLRPATGRPRSRSTSSGRSASSRTILPMTDEPVRTAGPDRRRLARVPGVLRPSPPGADGPRRPVRRDRRRTADARGRGRPRDGAGRSSSRRRTRSCRSARSSPCPGMREALASRARAGRPGRRGVGHRRRPGPQGTGRPDARLARPRGQRARRRPAATVELVDGFVLDRGRCGPRAGDRRRSGCATSSPTRS